MTKSVVTGGAGFIGKHLVEGLKAIGHEVEVVDIKTEGDIRDLADLNRRFKGAEYVFHLAALPRVQYSIENPELTHETNVTGTLNVLSAAHSQGVKKVIFSSSSSVYGDNTSLPLSESMLPHPISPYALHKYIGELYCKLYSEIYKLPTISLRYFNVYGPGATVNDSYPLVMPIFLEQKKQGKPLTITGDGTQTRDFTHVRDVVRANILAANSIDVVHSQGINIGAGKNISINEIAKLIGGPIEYVPARLEPHDTLADNRLAKLLLGWAPSVSIEEGINELLHETK